MKQKINLPQASEGLALYAARRLVGFEQGRPGESCCQPETRHGWIRGIIQGMAEVCGQDAAPLLRAFGQRLDAASGSSNIEPLPLNRQKYTVQNLRRYVSALGRMEGDQRARIFAVKKLLEDVGAYLPWDVGATGVYPAREETEQALLRAVAQRPIRFTRILLGGELDPGGVEYLHRLHGRRTAGGVQYDRRRRAGYGGDPRIRTGVYEAARSASSVDA